MDKGDHAVRRKPSKCAVCRPRFYLDPSISCDNKDVMRAITTDPDTMHGVPVFRGTRVPVQTLFDYLGGGDTLEDFLEGFPTVSRVLAFEVLEEAKQQLLNS